MQKIFHVLGLENIPFNLWQEMKISYPWSQSLPTRLLRSVMKKNYLGDPSSPIKYTPDGDPIWLRMCLRLVMTCNQISPEFWELARLNPLPEFLCEFVLSVRPKHARKHGAKPRKHGAKPAKNSNLCLETTLRGVAKQQKSVGNCKKLHSIKVQNKLLKILKVTISWYSWKLAGWRPHRSHRPYLGID